MLYQWMKEKRQIQNNNRIKKQAENTLSGVVFGLFFIIHIVLNLGHKRSENLKIYRGL